MEISRASDPDERSYWKRQLVCHHYTLIPFVNERTADLMYDKLHKNKLPQVEKKRPCSDGFYHILAPSLISILVSVVCLCGASWAWFSASQANSVASIQTSTYTITVTSGEASYHLDKNRPSQTIPEGTYTFTAGGNSSTGYAKITVGDKTYLTSQLAPGQSLTITVDSSAKVTLCWGSSAIPDRLTDGAIISNNTENNKAEP